MRNPSAESMVQESEIAKFLGGKTQPNSGGTRFGGGDIHTKQFLIEAKTVNTPQHAFNMKHEYLTKAREQAFEQGKDYWALAFRCDPQGPDYFVISRGLFKRLMEFLEDEQYREDMRRE